jgi:hypothetical protein
MAKQCYYLVDDAHPSTTADDRASSRRSTRTAMMLLRRGRAKAEPARFGHTNRAARGYARDTCTATPGHWSGRAGRTNHAAQATSCLC